MSKKQIPNMLSILRLCMIPIFITVYFSEDRGMSLIIYVIAWLTDIIDGYLARRYNWVTNLGKILDPLADKLMQVAAVTCLIIDNKLPLFVIVVLVGKELMMLIGALVIMHSKRIVLSSDWFGKLCTAVLFAAVIILMLVETPPVWLESFVAIAVVAVLLFSFVMYSIKAYQIRKIGKMSLKEKTTNINN